MSTNDVAPQEIRFEFAGNAREYFGIWIVNVLLTLVTLGIYSAWAKVRRKRYFYGNTKLSGSSFAYLADPVAILKGWFLAVVVFAIYSATTHFYPRTAPIFFLAFLMVLPWLVVRAASFNAHNTAFRNVRFHFAKNYSEAVKVFVGLVVLIPFTLGLILPYYAYRQKKFIVDHSSYGSSRFKLDVGPGKFYVTYLKALGALLVSIGFITIAVPISSAFFGKPIGDQVEVPKQALMMSVIVVMTMMALYFAVFLYLSTAVTNLIWNHAEIGGNRFRSTLQFRRIFWLYLSNIFAIALSLGLLAPWARVRLTRYRLGNLVLLATGDLDDFIAKTQTRVDAAGEEMSELFGVDIGL